MTINKYSRLEQKINQKIDLLILKYKINYLFMSHLGQLWGGSFEFLKGDCSVFYCYGLFIFPFQSSGFSPASAKNFRSLASNLIFLNVYWNAT